jgi:hypothetical protein
MRTIMNGVGGTGILLALAFGAARPALADPPGIAAAQRDFERTCASVITTYEAEMHQRAAIFYSGFVSRYGIGDGTLDQLATADELRQKLADAVAEGQRIVQMYVGTPYLADFQRKMRASDALAQCMFSVGIRYARGGGAAAARPAAPAAAPRH